MTAIDITHLTTVTGGIREGGCIVPDPMVEHIMESLRNAKFPTLPHLPTKQERKEQP